MKKVLLALAGVPLLVGGVALASAPAKVTICHATSSATNPYTRIVVSVNAIGGHFDNPGTPKAGHEDDLLLEGEVDCPPPKVVNPPEPPVKPEDKTPAPPATLAAPAPSSQPSPAVEPAPENVPSAGK